MNIVYLLENLDKKEGRRFYIGAKTECFLEDINGVTRIVSSKTGMPYYGSSSCPFMKQDMAAANRLNATILEEVPEKKDLLAIENEWIKRHDAINSAEYYNMSYAVIGGLYRDQFAMYNMYGETICDFGKAKSTLNRKHGTAKRFGFKGVGEFSIWLHNKLMSDVGPKTISEELGWERHSPRRYISDYNMPKCIEEYDEEDDETRAKVRRLIVEGVSAKRIAELLGLEIPTVCLYIGDYEKIYSKAYLVAHRAGLTKEELEVKITKMVLDGAGFNLVSRELSINESSVKRYFLRCVRSRLKSSDL